MTYDHEKTICDICGISKKEAEKHPVDMGINHPTFRYSTAFYLSDDGTVRCAWCHRENQLRILLKE